MQVQFWGAARTVTGSMHRVDVPAGSLLLDCGLYQGKRKLAFWRNRDLPFPAEQIDAVLLSHAHIDHSGNLPSLVRHGFAGRIHATQATRSLATHLLLDSAQIQASDVRYVNRIREQNQQTPFEPLYTRQHALQTLRQFKAWDFDEPFSPLPGVTCRFHGAGHMLGAAQIELELERPSGPPVRLLYSGDLGRPDAPILKDPEVVGGVDYLVMEATYGDRIHSAAGDPSQMLRELIDAIWESRGKLIIPAFSVGRTQEIVYHLNHLHEQGLLPPIHVFVDSPLAIDAHTIFQEHFDDFNATFAERMLADDDNDPLDFPNLHLVRKVQHSKMLNDYQEPCVIISASGMLEGGRVLHHLRQHIEKESTILLFAGYQAPDTLGRQIVDGRRDVKIFGQPFQVKARVEQLPGSSGHADQQELIVWARSIADQGDLKQIALVHCELECARALQEQLEAHGLGPVLIPDRGESMSILGA